MMEDLIKRLKKKHGTSKKRKRKATEASYDLKTRKQPDGRTEHSLEKNQDNILHTGESMNDDTMIFSVYGDTSNMNLKSFDTKCSEGRKDHSLLQLQ